MIEYNINNCNDIYKIIKSRYNIVTHHFIVLDFDKDKNIFKLSENKDMNNKNYNTLFVSNKNFVDLKSFLIKNYFSAWYNKEPLYHSITCALFENRNNIDLYYLLLFEIILHVLEEQSSFTKININLIKNLHDIVKEELFENYEIVPSFQIYNRVKTNFIPPSCIIYRYKNIFDDININNTKKLSEYILLTIDDIMSNNKLLAIYNYDDIFKKEIETGTNIII